MPRLIDAHTHVQFAAYRDDAEDVIGRALGEDIWLVNVGTQKDTSVKAVEIAEKYSEGVYATVGLHPIHTEKSFHDSEELGDNETATGFTSRGEEFDYEYYKKLGENPKVVAVGECGLDYYVAFARSHSERTQKGASRRSFSEGRAFQETKEKQEKVFIAQIELAAKLKKPLMIHCRNAYADLIRVLDLKSQLLVSPAGIIHFMSGTLEDAKRLLDLGFYFSFGGVITFVQDYDNLIKNIGLERIILETDAPYVTPVPHRGKRNEPAYVSYVVEKLAEILGEDVEEVAKQTTKNALAAFNI